MHRESFTDNWSFHKQGGEAAVVLSLPHDAMIHEQRSAASPSGSAGAHFPGGVYEYEKAFTAPADWADKTITLQFEGVYKDSQVYVNGQLAGGRPYGYVSFFVPLDPYLKPGETNTVRVVASNTDMPNSRWYTGSGIYRPVWLWTGHKNHISIEGVQVSTLAYSPARIRVETAHTGGSVAVEILDGDTVVAQGVGDCVELDIPGGKLWSPEYPHLYQCRATLSVDGVVVDEATDTFGVRKVEWGPKGLFVNGRQTLLRGGCVHHDNGILGACSYPKAEERRVRILKQAGYNAIRSSHNPASKAMLEACDRLGMYVMDETWDMWYKHKSKHDYAAHFDEWYKADIEAMVSRDFNHPSVILYSIGNEITEPAEAKGVQLASEMTEYIHSLDQNRAVTCGVNLWLIHKARKGQGVYKDDGGLEQDSKQDKLKNVNSTVFNMITAQVGTSMNKGAKSKAADEATSPFLDMLDIAGYNYSSGRYPLEGKAHPGRVVVGSETFPQDIAKNWAMVKKYPYLVGDFVWTSWDYLGEAGLGAWAYTPDGKGFDKPYPWLLADCGTIDILGNIGPQANHAAAVWGLLEKPAIHVRPVNHSGEKPAKMVWRGTNSLPSWAWRGCEGCRAEIEVYSSANEVELQLDGKRLGKKRIKDGKATFGAKYRPGSLTAIAYDANGHETGRSELAPADGKLRIQVLPEQVSAAPGELVYVDVTLTGENGVVESNADTRLAVYVEGGELLAFGSANPRTEERFDAGSYTTYYGRAQAIVRGGKAGQLTLHVTGDGLPAASASVAIE